VVCFIVYKLKELQYLIRRRALKQKPAALNSSWCLRTTFRAATRCHSETHNKKFRSKHFATGKARNSSIDLVRQAEYQIAVSSCSAFEIEFQTA